MERTHKLTLSNTDKKVAGVCGGIGEFIGMDPTLIRLAFVLFTLAGGSGVLLYIILAVIMPNAEEF